MGRHLERILLSWLAVGPRFDAESNGRGRKRGRRRFQAALLPLEDRRLLSLFQVTSPADDGSAGTLRWAVAGANADTTPSKIEFELGTAATTITLTQGQLDLSNTSESATIYDGPGEGPVTISGNNQSGAFQVNTGVTASISGLTIINGATRVGAGDPGYGSINDLGTLNLSDCTISNNNTGNDVYINGTADITDCTITGGSSYYGAGVFVFVGTAELTGCTIDDNTSPGNVQGAGVCNAGTTTLVNCTISGNSGGGGGGGIYNFTTHGAPALLMMYSCTVSGNTCDNEGAGLANDGIAYLTGCTISGNSNDNLGGGVWNRNGATLDLSDCTISANNASVGGGLFNSGTATLVACTISGNTTYNSGAGIYAGSTLTLNNTIVAGNESAPYDSGSVSPSDIAGTSVSGSNDLVGTGGSAGLSSTTNQLGVADPDLGPLADNGGPTATMALLPGSLAIGNGSEALEVSPQGSPLTTDQRGQPLDTPNPDIGAYQTHPLISLSFKDLTSPGIAYGTASVMISGTLSNGDQAPPDTESIEVTLDGATQSAAFGTGGAFTTTFDTSTLPASATPYTVTYNYAGDAEFAAATTTGTVTVSQDTPAVNLTDSNGTYTSFPFVASATITGVNGSAGSSLEGVPLVVAYYAGTDTAGTPLGGAPIDAGTYTVVASFAGSTDYVAATSLPVNVTISQATPILSLVDTSGSYKGSAFASSATITGVNGSAGSSLEGVPLVVAYYAGTSVTGTPLSGAPIDPGTYTVAASFAGSTDYIARAATPVTFTISRATPTLSVADGGTYDGSAFAATATVTGVSGTPASSLEGVSPTVTYYAGSTAAGAPLSVAPVDAGIYTVVARFAGSADYVAATSAPVTFTISRATPALRVVDPDGTYNGSAFDATATVAGLSGSAGSSLEGVAPTPVYYAGTMAAGTPLLGAPIAGGTYTVVARFPGSADYSPGQSAPVTFTIGPASVTIALASSGGSTVYGQPVTLVATVAAADGTPAGAVTFFDGATALATVPLASAGSASLTTSVLAVGTQSITVSYSGSPDFLGVDSGSGSESPAEAGNQLSTSVSVAKAGTQVVLATSPLFKKKTLVSVGLTAEVMPIAPGAGVPEGAVMFEMIVKDKGKKAKTKEDVLGTANLVGGQATLKLKADQVLKKSITIAYSGNADFASSTATPPALTQQARKSSVRPLTGLDFLLAGRFARGV
jgi:hypothetical protein